MSTVIRVDPASVVNYGNQAQAKFEQIRSELEALVRAVVEVRYFGPNAVQFKTQAGELASTFANNLNADMGAMADAIRTSTTNIAASLGGSPIVIEVSGTPIVPPAPETVDYVDVDTAALEGLKSTVSTHFGTITGLIEDHQAAFMATDWQGNARQNAEGMVQQFTRSATTKSSEAEQALTSYITSQIEAATTADV